jgi:hypothetical protein
MSDEGGDAPPAYVDDTGREATVTNRVADTLSAALAEIQRVRIQLL